MTMNTGGRFSALFGPDQSFSASFVESLQRKREELASDNAMLRRALSDTAEDRARALQSIERQIVDARAALRLAMAALEQAHPAHEHVVFAALSLGEPPQAENGPDYPVPHPRYQGMD